MPFYWEGNRQGGKWFSLVLKPLVHSDPYDSVFGMSPYPEVESLVYGSACNSDFCFIYK